MAACSFRPASSVPGGSGMLVLSTGRPIISIGGTTLPCPGLAVSSAATTTPQRSGNGRGLAVLGIAVPQAVWSLLPAASRGVVALAVPEGASGWGMLHSGDLPATSDEFDNIEEPDQDKEGLLLETGASGTFRPAASSVEVPEEVWRLLPEGLGVVNFTVPATTDDEDGLHKDALSPTSAAGFYDTVPVGPCFGVRREGKRGAAIVDEPGQDKEGLLLQTGAFGTFRPAASSVAVPELRGVVTFKQTFTVPATTEVEDSLDKDERHKQHGLLSPTTAAGSYTIPVGICSGVHGHLIPVGPCFLVRGEGKRGATIVEEPRQDQEVLLLQTGASGTFRPAASSVAVPEVWRLLPEDRGVVNFMVPATTEDEDGLDKDALHKQHGLLSSPTRAVGFYTVPVGTCSGVRGLLFPFGPCFGVRGEGKRGAAVFAMPKHASAGWGLMIGRHAKPDLLSCRSSSDGRYAQDFLAKLAEVRRQVTVMHVFVGDQYTNEEVDNATRTCTGVLIDVVVAADLGREEWKMKMQDAVDMAVVFEELAAECRAGVVVNHSLKSGIRTIRKLAGLVASETVLPPSWEDDELEEYAAMAGKGLYFRAMMDEFSELAEAVKSAVADKLKKP